jgi:hypothetical protein
VQISFDEHLLVTLLLRGLPEEFNVFCSTIRYREKVPSFDEVCAMIKVEEKTLLRKRAMAALTAVTRRDVPRMERCTVPGCGRSGHSEDQCWTLHPELAPVCRKCGRPGHVMRHCRTTNTVQNNAVEVMQPLADGWEGQPPVSL